MSNISVRKPPIFLVSDGSSHGRFGTAFIVHTDSAAAYLLTCAHVVEDVGAAALRVQNYPATVVALGEDGKAPDLAVLRVPQLKDKAPWPLQPQEETGVSLLTEGFCRDGNQYLQRKLRGKTGEIVPIHLLGQTEPFTGFDLAIDNGALQPGNSGSPVWNPKTGTVFGVVSRRQVQGREGLAISVEALQTVWPEMPPLVQPSRRRIKPLLLGGAAAVGIATVAAVALGNFRSAAICPAVALTPNAAFERPSSTVTAVIRVAGSTSMADLNRALALDIQNNYSAVRVTTSASGSQTGLDQLAAGEIDVAAVSTLIDQEMLERNGWGAFAIAPAPIAVVVGRNNPYLSRGDSLTQQQLRDIYTGRIGDWSQVSDGPSAPIRPINRFSTSGTRQEFESLVMGGEAFGPGVEEWPRDATTEVISELGSDGIYYATCHQVANQQQAAILSIDGHSPADEAYPYKRPLLYVYALDEAGQPEREASIFLGFANSQEGRTIVQDTLQQGE